MTQNETPINWEPYHDMIWTKYVLEDKTLKDTMKYMKDLGLKATIKQYKSRYSGFKNIKADEWIAVAEEVQRRTQRGVASEVYTYGRVVSEKQVKRGIRGHWNKTSARASREVDVTGRSDRDKISIRTPRSQSPAPASLPVTSPQLDMPEQPICHSDFSHDANGNLENRFGDSAAIAIEAVPFLGTFSSTSEGLDDDMVERKDLILSNSLSTLPSEDICSQNKVFFGGCKHWYELSCADIDGGHPRIELPLRQG